MKINWVKSLGFAVVIYAIAFLVASVFVAFKLETTRIIPWLVTTVAVLITAYILAQKLGVKNINEALVYGAIWVVVLLALDYIITLRFAPEYFTSWMAWAGYVLVFLVPAASIYLKKK